MSFLFQILALNLNFARSIHPRTRFMVRITFVGLIKLLNIFFLQDFIRLLSDPDRVEMARMQRAGAIATWPRVRHLS